MKIRRKDVTYPETNLFANPSVSFVGQTSKRSNKFMRQLIILNYIRPANIYTLLKYTIKKTVFFFFSLHINQARHDNSVSIIKYMIHLGIPVPILFFNNGHKLPFLYFNCPFKQSTMKTPLERNQMIFIKILVE